MKHDEVGMQTLEVIREKGASNCLTTLPKRHNGFSLSKRKFRDAVAMRCNFAIKARPHSCPFGE